MSSIILLLVIVVVVVVVLAILKAKAQGGAGDEAWPFYAKNLSLNPSKSSISGLSKHCPNISSSRKFNFPGCSA